MAIVRVASALVSTQTRAITTYRSRRQMIFFRAPARTAPRPREEPWSAEMEDTAILLFTSGTTGAPKAAVLRQKHLVSYVLGSVEFMSADENDASLSCVPPYHIAGMAGIVSAVYSGRRVIQMPKFTAEDWIATAREQNVSHAMVVPTMLSRIVDVLEDEKDAGMPNLRNLAYGGGKMPQSVIEKAMELFPGHELHECLRPNGNEFDDFAARSG